jgi:hypothetical protein
MPHDRQRTMKPLALSMALLAAAVPALAQAHAAAYVPGKTPEGFPNLEGIWLPQHKNAMYSVLPHPPGFLLGSGSKEGIVEGGVLPYTPEAAKMVDYRLQHMELDPTGHCHYEGIPHAMYFAFQIFQTPDYIAFVHENMHAWRIVYMKGEHPKDYLAWMGDSRGHWEGDTLVVDVANNNDKSVFDMAGHFHSDALHVVERFTPVDHDNIAYEVTLEDPKVFTRPVKMKFSFKRAPKDYQIMEAGCFEGERDQNHIVEGLAAIKDHYDSKRNTEPGAAEQKPVAGK